MFNYQIDVLSALTDSDISEFEELDIDELTVLTEQIKWINSEPSKRHKNKIDNYVLKPYSKLSLGEFIDLEHYFSNNYLDHFCHILALLYRRTSKNVYGDDIIEPYEYSPRDRLDWYLDYKITDVYGLIPEYIKFRENFTNTYTNLLVDVVPDDEVLEDADEIKEQKKKQEKQKFAWESTIMSLCNNDLSKFNDILDMSVVLVFNILGMKKTLD
ncbi:hypothetical protein EBS67_14460 [bacterium]|nr:hypothetical protein [bacterium]